MKRKLVILCLITANVFLFSAFPSKAFSYWIWTPETKKFVNPKYAVKDSPKEQFEWAMQFYNSKDYQRAATEFEKLTKQYEYSEYASKSQYYVGLCYENMNKFYTAFQNYQKAVDNFPHIENLDEIIAREFNIAGIYANKPNPKVLGTDILTSLDRSVEIYKKVVDNAPYGRLADEAQFNMAQALKKSERYDEAIPAFQKILDDYPDSKFYDKARFEVADCAYKASLKPAYDKEGTDKAIRAFEDLSQSNIDNKLAEKADKTIQRLKDRAAEKSFMTAQFYESQRHYESAIIYYKDVVSQYPDSSFTNKAKARIEGLDRQLNKKAMPSAQKDDNKTWLQRTFSKQPKPPQTTEARKKAENPKKSNFWSPLSFPKPAKKEAAEKKTEDKPKEPKKSWWKALSFEGKPKQAKPAVEQKEKVSAKPRKSWSPLSFPKPAKKETAKPKKGWSPLSFDKSAKKKASGSEVAKEAAVETAPPQKTASADTENTEENNIKLPVAEEVAPPDKKE